MASGLLPSHPLCIAHHPTAGLVCIMFSSASHLIPRSYCPPISAHHRAAGLVLVIHSVHNCLLVPHSPTQTPGATHAGIHSQQGRRSVHTRTHTKGAECTHSNLHRGGSAHTESCITGENRTHCLLCARARTHTENSFACHGRKSHKPVPLICEVCIASVSIMAQFTCNDCISRQQRAFHIGYRQADPSSTSNPKTPTLPSPSLLPLSLSHLASSSSLSSRLSARP